MLRPGPSNNSAVDEMSRHSAICRRIVGEHAILSHDNLVVDFSHLTTQIVSIYSPEKVWIIFHAYKSTWLMNLSGAEERGSERYAACLRSVSLYPLVRQSDAIHCLPRAFAHLALQAGSTNMYYK